MIQKEAIFEMAIFEAEDHGIEESQFPKSHVIMSVLKTQIRNEMNDTVYEICVLLSKIDIDEHGQQKVEFEEQ